jgi:hypothetical protein
MRCYFLRNNRIAGVDVLPVGLSDKEAIARAHLLSLRRKVDGFEVWHRSRCVVRFPPPPRRLRRSAEGRGTMRVLCLGC